jgi:nucleoside-diphosphate-sugar epimerase
MQSQESRDAAAGAVPELEAALGDCYRGRKVLITGGLGFLGSNLAIRLVSHGANVTLMDSLIYQGGGSLQNIAAIRDEVAVKTSDMRDGASLDMLVQGREYIFNLAAHVSHADSMREPQLDLSCNCVATLNLVEACRKFAPDAKLVYTSTRQVYGRPKCLPVTEEHPAVPIDINGIHKLAAEYYHLLYDGAYGLRSSVLRLTNTYGPRQRINDDRQGVAAVFLRQALLGNTIDLFGGGHQRRDFNYVDDVVDALLLAASNSRCYGKVFNLGAPTAHSLLEFTAVLRELCQFAVRCVPFPDDHKIIDIGDYYGDFSAFREATGWAPKTSLEEGLRQTIAFYREQGNSYL